MLGWRGASRYYSEPYREGFALECRALRKVRAEIGLHNVIVMIPFCRTPQEADRVLEVMAENGLRRGVDGLEVYVMCEIPSFRSFLLIKMLVFLPTHRTTPDAATICRAWTK